MVNKIINQILKEFNFIKMRSENLNDWELVHNEIIFHKLDFSKSLINYRISYLRQKMEVHDFSLIFYELNQPVGIIPLCIYSIKDKYFCDNFGEVVLPPFFLKSISSNKKIFFSKNLINIFRVLFKSLSIDKLVFQINNNFDNESINEFSNYLLENKFQAVHNKNEIYLYLGENIAETKKHFRKSYKPLINANFNKFEISVVENNNDLIWEEFRKLHKREAGRVTRDEATWNSQMEAINNEEAFITYLKDKDIFRGFAFFFVTRDECLYASAAYDRSFFKKIPIGHLIQYKSIMHMIEKKKRFYKLGDEVIEKTNNVKQKNIDLFKKGFASNILPTFTYTLATKYL